MQKEYVTLFWNNWRVNKSYIGGTDVEQVYIVAIDQSTQGTKALLLDRVGQIVARSDLPHKQIVNDLGWVEHDPCEIYKNTLQVVVNVIHKAGIAKEDIVGVGISNQRETALAWDISGCPIYHAIVWQCARGEAICKRIQKADKQHLVKERTGLPLSPYFSAAKIAWILENIEDAREKAEAGELYYGTIDSYLVYRLTGGKSYKTDYSNASRTQLFNISTLKWDDEVCELFGIPGNHLAEVMDSNGFYGETDFEGFLPNKIPIYAVIGDSHGALLGQGCMEAGMIKATFGTGSSVMMNIGSKIKRSNQGLVTSLAWGLNGTVDYVLEGNINYAGAVVTWLEKDLHLVKNANETQELALAANPEDRTYLVPAFTGLGAPYWHSDVTGMITGITRTTGKNEIVRASLESIAYQITDVLTSMEDDSGLSIQELRVDGGPTKNVYLMQFLSDLADIPVMVPQDEELSALGAGYAAGVGLGIYSFEKVFSNKIREKYLPRINKELREEKISGWKRAIQQVIGGRDGDI